MSRISAFWSPVHAVPATERQYIMAGKLRAAVIGCGVIGPAHVESYQRLADVEVAWACDIVPAKAEAMARKYGIARTTADYREVLADKSVDCISVCTDHASHAPISADALNAGKHVLCEKALAANEAGLEQMFAAHRRNSGLVFSGIFQHRFDRVHQYLKRLVDEGVMGQLLTAGVQMRCLRTNAYYQGDNWRGTWDKEGGAVLINQAIHFIDALVWITGGVESLCGAHRNLTHGDVIETEDTAVATLAFRNGALGSIEATCSSHLNWEPTLSIHGSKGSIDLRHGEAIKAIFDDPAVEAKVRKDLADCRDSKVIESVKSYYGPSHPTQLADFVDAIRDNRPPFVSAASARHTVEVVLGIYRSHSQGRWVKLAN